MNFYHFKSYFYFDISNQTLHNDLKTIEEESAVFYKRFFSRLGNHGNPLIKKSDSLTLPENPRRRLKKRPSALSRIDFSFLLFFGLAF